MHQRNFEINCCLFCKYKLCKITQLCRYLVLSTKMIILIRLSHVTKKTQVRRYFYSEYTVPCTSRANCARHMHHLLSVPILTIENYFHSQVTAFFMRTKKVLNSVSQKSRIDEIFIIIAKRLTKHKVKWQH